MSGKYQKETEDPRTSNGRTSNGLGQSRASAGVGLPHLTSPVGRAQAAEEHRASPQPHNSSPIGRASNQQETKNSFYNTAVAASAKSRQDVTFAAGVEASSKSRGETLQPAISKLLGSQRNSIVFRGTNGGTPIEEEPPVPVEKPVEVFEKFDGFALRPKIPTMIGGIITVGVWAGTIIYSVIAIYIFANRPASLTSYSEWSIAAGPFPMTIQCMATNGCLVSNTFRENHRYSAGLSGGVDGQCFNLAYEQEFNVSVVYSTHPLDGLSIIYEAGNNVVGLPDGFGYTVKSEVNCFPGLDCIRGRSILPSPGGPGMSLLNHVFTTNKTRSDLGRHRREWFVTPVSTENAERVDGSYTCEIPPVADESIQFVQARLRLQSFWHRVVVQQPNAEAWMNLFGTCGGSFSTFIQIGAIILLLTKAVLEYVEKIHVDKAAQIQRVKSGQVAPV